MNRIEKAQHVVDHFIVPEQLIDKVMLTEETEKDKVMYTLTPIIDLDRDTKLTANLDGWQANVISFGISDKISKHHEEYTIYSIFATQTSYDLVYNKTKEGKKFKEYVMIPGWIHGREVFHEPDEILPDSVAYEEGGKYLYKGKAIRVRVDRNDFLGTLEKAGVFEKSEYKVQSREIGGFEDNYSSAWSSWYAIEGCFYAGASRPSGGVPSDFSALEKTYKESSLRERKLMIENIELF